MKRNPLNKGIIMENAAGIGPVTTAMVEARARELAPSSTVMVLRNRPRLTINRPNVS
jgi:hypothetical protein